jgi:hypothetical protein
MTRRAAILVLASLAPAACSYAREELTIPDADTRQFVDDAYPILLADCGYPTCHGSSERFFQIYGPGRTRLDPMTDAYAPVTAQELALSFARARSMLIGPKGPRRAPLLRKPLAVAAGGAKHEGDDPWGNAIYATKRDPRWELLFFWATDASGAAE